MLTLDLNIIWTLIDLAVMFLVLRHFLFRPVNAVMQKRQEMIQHDLQDAQKNKQQAQELKLSYEKIMKNVKQEEAEMLTKAKEDAKQQYHTMMEEAKAEIQKFRKNAEHTMEEQKQKAMRDLKQNTADMVILAAQKVAEKEMTPQANQHMIDAFLAEVGEKQ